MSRIKQSVETMKKQMEVTKEEEKYRDENHHLNEYIKYYKCTKCGVSFISKINKGVSISVHPLLDVLMCSACCNYYGDGNFSLDSEGEDKYCRWCGEGGTLFSCSKCICAFCKKCVKKHFNEKEFKQIENDDDWICFFCDSKPLWYLRLICTFAKEASEKKKAELELKPKDKYLKTRKRRPTKTVGGKDIDSSDTTKNSSSDSGVRKKKRRKCKFGSSLKTCSISSSETEKENRLNRHRKTQQKKGKISIRRNVAGFRSSKNFKTHAESSDEDGDGNEDEDEDQDEDEDEDESKIEDDNKEENKDKDKDKDENRDKNVDLESSNKLNQSYIIDKLKGIWKITQILSEIGLKWSRERLDVLSKPNDGETLINLEKEYRKIKSVTSMLSSSINKACDSVESLRDDLNSDNVKDERHVFRCEEANIVRLAKKLVDDSDMEDSLMHVPSSTNMRKKYERPERHRDETGDKSGSENGKSDRHDGRKSDQSQSLFSCADTESEVDESKEVTEVKKDSAKKPLLKVKDFAKMKSENIFANVELVFANDQEKKEENEYEVETECSSDEEIVGLQKKKKREPLSTELSDEKSEDQKGTKRTRKKKIELNDKFGVFKEKRKQYLLNATQSENDKKKTEKKAKMAMLESSTESEGQHGENDSDEWIEKRRKNRHRKKILTSNDEEEKEEKSNSDSSLSPERRKNSRRAGKKGTKKAQCRVDTSSEEGENDPELPCPNKKKEGRKNIKKILKKNSLKLSTKEALKTEEERRKRVEERNKLLEKIRKVKQAEFSGGSSADEDNSSYTSDGNDGNDKKLGTDGKEEEVIKGKGEDTTKGINENNKKNVQSNEEKRDDRPRTLILDFDVDTEKPLVTVHKKLVKKLKPHQIEGVKFMWDNCFESVKRLEEDSGSGCILAHYMGLGKTLQVVTLVHTVMNHNLGVHSVLIICPLSTLSNWVSEFEMWLNDIRTDTIMLYDLLSCKKNEERLGQVKEWQRTGGVMFLSYELFRTLVKPGKKKTKTMQRIFEESLCDPGPDLVVCDEGHLLKNEETALSKCVNQIKTARRIVLTGTPLQNNLMEYHCMVQFVKPNILGTKKEFSNRFVNPITNGQFEDSTEEDVRIMKRRSHVLHSMLNGCVQRCDYSVLTPYLPKKYEYVLSIVLTSAQIKAYRYFIENLSTKMLGSSRTATLFNDYHNLQRLWTHPWVLRMHKEKESQRGFDSAELKCSMKDFIVYSDDDTPSGQTGSDVSLEEVIDKRGGSKDSNKRIEEASTGEKDWWTDYFREPDYEDIRSGNKLMILFFLLKACGEIGDKVLVFSQSLYSLDLIEHFLSKVDEATSSELEGEPLLSEFKDSWVSGVDYFRLDGQTNVDLRSSWCKLFNQESNKRARLFLISTRAGGLGINLVAANRVVMFDASWNPSHDLQSIFRVYRFGQKKTCYIYRFLAEATMEEKIYERQVTKLSLAHRVVDEHQIERHYSMMNLHELYTFKPTPSEKRKTPKLPKDKVLAKILVACKEEIVSYHEHDSLLANKEEEELTEEERKAAWQEFEEEQAQKKEGIPFDLLEFQKQLTSGMVNPYAGAHLQEGMFPMLPSEIPADVLQKGLLLGLVPRYSETLESFTNRIQNRQLFIGSNDRET